MTCALRWRKYWYWLLLPLLVAATVFTADFKSDISAFFIAGDSAEEIFLANEMQSGKLSRRYLISIVASDQDSISSVFVAGVIDRFREISGVADVWQAGRPQFDIDTLQAIYLSHAAQLYSYTPQAELDALLTRQGLQERAAQLKQVLLSPQGVMLKKIALQDPLLLSLTGFKALGYQLQAMSEGGGTFVNLILETEMSGLDYTQQKRIQQQLQDVFAGLNEQFGQSARPQMTGVPVFAVATQGLIETDVKRVTLVSSLILTLLFLWLFRSLSALVQVASLLIAAVSVSVLVTQLIFGYVHGMTLAIGTTLVGICIDYPIHALVHARAVIVEKRRAVVAKIWPSMMLGGITTLVGYIALGSTGYPGFQQIAVYAGTGIWVSLLITRYLLPGMITNSRPVRIHLPLIGRWIGFCRRFRKVLGIILILLSVGACYAVDSLCWMKDLQQLTPELQPLKDNDRAIRGRMTSSIEPGRFIIVTGENLESVLSKSEQLYGILDQLRAKGELKIYFGLYPWLLSGQQQRFNQQLLQRRLSEPVPDWWRSALTEQGLSVARLSLPAYSAEPPLMLQTILDSPLRRLIDNQVFVEDRQALALIWLGQHQPQVLQAAVESVAGVHYFSQRDLLNRLADDYRERAQTMLWVGLGVIVSLLLLRYRNLVTTLQTLLPAVLAALFILAGWSVSGQSISFLHLVGFLLAVAICVDYGIFYRENRAQDNRLTYQAMAASMLTSAVAFGSLLTANTSSLQTLGGVVVLGVVLGFLFCPIVISHPPASTENRIRNADGKETTQGD